MHFIKAVTIPGYKYININKEHVWYIYLSFLIILKCIIIIKTKTPNDQYIKGINYDQIVLKNKMFKVFSYILLK